MIISTIVEPNLESVIEIEQRSFGVLTSNSERNYLETIGINTCLGLYLEDGETKVLAHLDPLNVTNGDVDHILQYFQQKWIDFRPTRAILVVSNQTRESNITKIKEYLENKGININVDYSELDSISVCVDKNGNYAHLIGVKSREIDQDIISRQDREFEQSMQKDHLYRLECATDRGWASTLEYLPQTERELGIDPDKVSLHPNDIPELPFPIIVTLKSNLKYFQRIGHRTSELMAREILASMDNKCKIFHGEYSATARAHPGDWIVRPLSSEEIARVRIYLGPHVTISEDGKKTIQTSLMRYDISNIF
ncbi:hypothetical protein HYX11_03965 [Candidatus Woesearchaeota archaeon]|nr:hypothetical protein [Candidatus Woesearchaeota archaeon]